MRSLFALRRFFASNSLCIQPENTPKVTSGLSSILNRKLPKSVSPTTLNNNLEKLFTSNSHLSAKLWRLRQAQSSLRVLR